MGATSSTLQDARGISGEDQPENVTPAAFTIPVDGTSRAKCPRCLELGIPGGLPNVRYPGTPVTGNGVIIPAKDYVDPFELHREKCPTRYVIIDYDTQVEVLTRLLLVTQASFHRAFHHHWPREAHERARKRNQIRFEQDQIPITHVFDPLFGGLNTYYVNGTQRNFEQHLKEKLQNVVKLRNKHAHQATTYPLIGGSRDDPDLYMLFRWAEDLVAEFGDQAALNRIRDIKRELMIEAHRIHDTIENFMTSFPPRPRVQEGEQWQNMTEDERIDLARTCLERLCPDDNDFIGAPEIEALVDYIDLRSLTVGPASTLNDLLPGLEALCTADGAIALRLAMEECNTDFVRATSITASQVRWFSKIFRMLLPTSTFEVDENKANVTDLFTLVTSINNHRAVGDTPFDPEYVKYYSRYYEAGDQTGEPLFMADFRKGVVRGWGEITGYANGNRYAQKANDTVALLQALQAEGLVTYVGDGYQGTITFITPWPDILDGPQKALLGLSDNIQCLLCAFAKKRSLETNLNYSDALVNAALLWRSSYLQPLQDDKFINKVIGARATKLQNLVNERARIKQLSDEQQAKIQADIDERNNPKVDSDLNAEQAAVNKAESDRLQAMKERLDREREERLERQRNGEPEPAASEAESSFHEDDEDWNGFVEGEETEDEVWARHERYLYQVIRDVAAPITAQSRRHSFPNLQIRDM